MEKKKQRYTKKSLRKKDPKIVNRFIEAVLFLSIYSIWFGLVFPPLISAKSNEMVIMACVGSALIVIGTLKFYEKTLVKIWRELVD